ncbi:hypothetical protein WJU23_06900 [Prosthecobacter sp. SYSU 5D2]|uniref:hypothetical protein n=1 Tax=Prosthecobacter sp. SYSU 5D2 TaxID=3134134 RepID=UPI0031FF262F
MKTSILCLLASFTLTAFAADGPEVRNGDFEKGKQFWRGDGKVVTLPNGGKACQLETSQRYSDELTQEVDFGKVTAVEVTWKMRSIGYEGNGLKVSFKRPSGGFTFFTYKTENGDSWKEMKMTFNRSTRDEKQVLAFSPYLGKGSIQIDDVKITTGSGGSPNLQ